jgi:hypothetical protein
MAAHIAAERSALHHTVKSRHLGGDHLADELLYDYHRMEELLVLIERRKVNSPDVPALVRDLQAATADHVQRARTKLDPALREALTPEEEADMAEKIISADDMVISHPHPHLLSLAP